MTTPSAEDARPADAGRASSPDSDVTDATNGTDAMDATDNTQDPAGGDTHAGLDTQASAAPANGGTTAATAPSRCCAWSTSARTSARCGL